MLREIAGAEASITIEAYIYWEGDIGRQFAQALADKARGGVRVKILLDAIGSSTIGDDILETLESGGCQLAWYNPIHWYINRTVQQPHSPEIADRGWTRRLHWRRRHCRPVARARPGCRPLARRADPHRRTGDHPAADRLRPELARTNVRAGLGPDLLSAARASRSARRDDHHELAGDRRLDRQDHVLPVDHLRATARCSSPIPILCRTPARSTR